MPHQPADPVGPEDLPTRPSPLSQQNYSSRIVVVEDFYHERAQGKSLQLRPGFRRFLKTNEQAYGPRELTATTTWKKVDSGWIEKVGMALVINSVKNVNLTYEEAEASTLELIRSVEKPNIPTNDQGVSDSPLLWYLPPEESFRGSPSSLNTLWVRSRIGEVPYTATVIPE